MDTMTLKMERMTRRLESGEIEDLFGSGRSEEPAEAGIAPQPGVRETKPLDRNFKPRTQKLEKEVARSLRDFADRCREQGKYRQAESLYKRALALTESVFGPDHIEVSAVLNNLAVLYKYTGNFDEAERLYRRALAIKEKLLGADHPDVAMTLNNLAVFYKSQKRFDEAESLFQRALAIFERALGPDHPKLITCHENYASLIGKMERLATGVAQTVQLKFLHKFPRSGGA